MAMDTGSQDRIISMDSLLAEQETPSVAIEASETGLEIVEDLVQMMTFQKLNYGPRCENYGVVSSGDVAATDVPKVRSRRARTVTAQSHQSTLEAKTALEAISPKSRPRKHSHDGSALDNRRKRSFSMYESEEDDELASLSSSTSFQSASKHQKLADCETGDEFPQFMPSDSIFAVSSLSSTSIGSSASSRGSLPHPIPLRMAVPRVSFPLQSDAAWNAAHCTATSSSTSPRSSPRSGASSPRTGAHRMLPSMFKRAQSDGEVLLRNSARDAHNNASIAMLDEDLAPTASHAMDVTDSEHPVKPTAFPPQSMSLSCSGRRSVSASSLPTTFRSLAVPPAAPSQPAITFSASPTTRSVGVLKPIALSPPTRRPRRTTNESLSTAVFITPPTSQLSQSSSSDMS